MAKKQSPSQPQVPSTEREQINDPIEPYELTPGEHAARTCAGTTVPGEIAARVDDRRYAMHWGINE